MPARAGCSTPAWSPDVAEAIVQRRGPTSKLTLTLRHRSASIRHYALNPGSTWGKAIMTTTQQWEDFLTPAVTQERLISASLYITAYEMLKESIIGRIKDFYCIGFDVETLTVSPAYKINVLSLNKSQLYSSLTWLHNSGVIDVEDLKTFENLKRLRNSLAHELPHHVFTGKETSILSSMNVLMCLLRKIEVWWVINIEIPTTRDYDGSEIDPDKVTPGPVLMMQMMFEILSGNESLLEHYKQVASHFPKSHT